MTWALQWMFLKLYLKGLAAFYMKEFSNF